MTDPITFPLVGQYEDELAKFLRARYEEKLREAVGDYDVRRDIESKLAIVALCEPPLIETTSGHGGRRTFVPGMGEPWGEPVLRLLAQPYDLHPDYKREWAL